MPQSPVKVCGRRACASILCDPAGPTLWGTGATQYLGVPVPERHALRTSRFRGSLAFGVVAALSLASLMIGAAGPAVARVSPCAVGPGVGSSGFAVAFQANTGDLWTVGSPGNVSWQLGMMPGTSPALAVLSDGGYVVAFQANTGNLWTAGSGGCRDWQLGMMPGTSPAIAGLSGGGFEVAFQANTSSLWTVGSAGNTAWQLGMMAGTSPGIAGLSGGGFEVAFQANTSSLWTVGSAGNAAWQLGMMRGTSPTVSGTVARSGFVSSISGIDAALAARMSSSWRPGCPVALTGLRYVTVSYRGFDGTDRVGEVVVAASAAESMVGVFHELYDLRYPIASLRLVDEFGGNDDRSMAANNTSAFNCRAVTGGVGFSEHSYGTAIDVNPVQNPYVSGATVSPPQGRPYLGRTPAPGVITAGDAVVAAFARIGWSWGGYWANPIDYQHFSASGR